MKRSILAAATAAVLGTTLVACADSPTSPLATREPAAPSSALLGLGLGTTSTSETVYGAQWKTPLTSNLQATATIGPLGGVLTLPATGLKVIVPPGAVLKPTNFGVTALAGRLVAYDFQPAGTRFLVPLVVTQTGGRVNTQAPVVGLGLMRPGYFKSATDLNQTTGQATVSELLPSITLSALGDMVFTVNHFSGYIVSWGRQ